MTDTKYLNGILIKERTFDNGGSQMKISIKTEDFINELKEVDENGWCNLIMNRRQTPSDKGVTHYIKVDTWKPDPNKAAAPVSNSNDKDDLPF
jgi:hypothetical protein